MKIKLKIITTVLLLTSLNSLFAQNAHFIKSGTIEFEKTVNMFALFSRNITKDNDSFLQPAFESFKKNQPQFKKLMSTLTFAENKTLFIPAADDADIPGFFGNTAIITQNNTVFIDQQTNTTITQKKVFEETFLVRDSTRKINWKITNETREVAGYVCRRANAIILDSIYVVAFYSSQISVTGGPETFTGLPGMILELALPHENIIWRATKITESSIDSKVLVPPKKGKPVNNKELSATLLNALKSWGSYKQQYLKAFSL